MMKRKKTFNTYISFSKQPMEYNNATLEGQSKLLIIGLLKKSMKKKSNNKRFFDKNSMSIIKRNHNKNNLASEKIQTKKFHLCFIKISVDLSSKGLVDRSTKRAKRREVQKNVCFLKTINFSYLCH